jgi:hypothetical protein
MPKAIEAPAVAPPKFVNMQNNPVVIQDEKGKRLSVLPWKNRGTGTGKVGPYYVEGEHYRQFVSRAGPLYPFPEAAAAPAQPTVVQNADPRIVDEVAQLLANEQEVDRQRGIGFVCGLAAGAENAVLPDSLEQYRPRLTAIGRAFFNMSHAAEIEADRQARIKAGKAKIGGKDAKVVDLTDSMGEPEEGEIVEEGEEGSPETPPPDSEETLSEDDETPPAPRKGHKVKK